MILEVYSLFGATIFNILPCFTSSSSLSSGGISGRSINSSESSSVESNTVSNNSLSSAFCLLPFKFSAIFSSGCDLFFLLSSIQ